MDEQKLLEKYRALTAENELLKKENARLKAQLLEEQRHKYFGFTTFKP